MSNTAMMKRGLTVAAIVLLVDQLSKWWIVSKVMQPPDTINITPFFNIVMGWNRGVSFGMFDSASPLNNWILPIVALAIVVGLLAWMRRVERLWLAVAIGMVIGGALGNVVDRLHYGAVADFLDFYIGNYHWPAFNVADSGITVGAAILIVDSLFFGEKNHKIKEDKGKR